MGGGCGRAVLMDKKKVVGYVGQSGCVGWTGDSFMG